MVITALDPYAAILGADLSSRRVCTNLHRPQALTACNVNLESIPDQ